MRNKHQDHYSNSKSYEIYKSNIIFLHYIKSSQTLFSDSYNFIYYIAPFI